MLSYFITRLLAMIPTLFGIACVTFLIINLAPGDPVSSTQGGDERTSEGANRADRQQDVIKAKKKLLGMTREDRTVQVWSAAEAARLTPQAKDAYAIPLAPLPLANRLGPFDGWIHSLAFDNQKRLLYSAGDDTFIRATDIRNGPVVATYGGHKVAIWSLALSPDGTSMVSGDIDGNLFLWKVASNEPQTSLPSLHFPIRNVEFLPDGSHFLSACDDGVVRVHEATTGRVVNELRGHVSGVYALALSKDGKRLFSGGYDRKIREWSVETWTLTGITAELGQAVNDLALSPDGTQIAAACDDRAVYLFQILEPSQPFSVVQKFEGHYKEATAVAFSSDGTMVFSGAKDESIRSWKIASGSLHNMTVDPIGRIHTLLVSPDGEFLWSGADGWVKVPSYIRFFNWLSKFIRLDFDRSFVDQRLVIEKIQEALPVTLLLNLLSLVIIYLVSVPLGVFAAVRRGSNFDHISSLVLFVLYSIPNFWFATLLIIAFSSKQNFDILPSVGLQPQNAWDLSYFEWLKESLRHLVLPLTVLVYAGFASLSRYARTSMLETIGQDYVRTARAKGLSETVVVIKHAFRNSLITIVTLVANLLPAMIGGSVIAESIFSIHGMGKLGFDAILTRDYPVIMAITTFSAFLTLFGILVSDLLYSVVDPRITHS